MASTHKTRTTHKLNNLLAQIYRCQVCAGFLPLGPKPIIQVSETARVLIIGQAPGRKAHENNMPWSDRSGERLISWLGISKDAFYNKDNIAIIPMGFCYPGAVKKRGDKPPRPECAPLWHDALFSLMPNIKLTLLVGSYAQRYYLKTKRSLTENVQSWRKYLPSIVPLPHPSWRCTGWIKRNPWFEQELIQELQRIMSQYC